MLMLLLYVGSECYALDACPIVEIIPKVHFKKIPHTADYVSGLITYGGTPVPVIDMPQIIEKRPSSPAMHTRIIIVQQGEQLLGLIGEKVTTTVDLASEQFIRSGVQVKDLPFLGGVYRSGEQSIQFIQLDELYKFLHGTLF